MAPKHLCSSALLATAIVFFFSCGQRHEFKRETSFINVGDKTLRVYTGGEGENTVVFESGLGVDGTTWLDSGVFDSIGRDNQVIAYDRAGMGQSTDNGETRGLQALADDLASVIDKTSAHEKVILVGHSLGGSIIRTYAIQHPGKVKALVFLDTNHEGFAPYATMSQGNEDTLVQAYKDEKITGAAQEAAQLLENITFLKKLPPLPDVPVIIITSIKTDEEMTPENVQAWVKAHESLGKGISNFTHIKTSKSGHFIQEDEPNLVIENIRKLLK